MASQTESGRCTALSPATEPTSAEPGFETLHRAVVGLVIVAEAVQQSVQRQEAQLPLERVSALGRLGDGARHRDHDVAEMAAVE